MRVAVFALKWGGVFASLASLAVVTAGLTEMVPERLAWGQESRLNELRAAAKESARNVSVALALGRALRKAGHLAEAVTQLRTASTLAARPEDQVAANVELARAYEDQGDFNQAMFTCKKLEHLAPAEWHACAAGAHFVRQRATEALSETAQALAADPRSYDAKVAEGRAYEFELDGPKAEAALREAIAMNDGAVDAHLILGRVLLRNHRRDEGTIELRRAVALDPLGPDALFELASALGPGPDGIVLLERAARERPSFAAVWLSLGVQRLAAGQIAPAAEAAQAALRAEPNSVRARVLLGQVALAEGRIDEAIKAGETVLQAVANDAAAQLLVADGNARKGEIDRALEAYQAAWGLDHSDPTALVSASVACHRAARDTSARAFGVRATQEFPAWAPGWVALGDALAAQGESRPAHDAYEKALAAGSGSIDRDAIQRKIAAR